MTTDPKSLPGTHLAADRSRVEFSAAMAAWLPLAYDHLITTARTYHAVTTYLELSEHVQDVSGIRTRVLLTNWIGKLLEAVAVRAKMNGRAADHGAVRSSGRDDRAGVRASTEGCAR